MLTAAPQKKLLIVVEEAAVVGRVEGSGRW
jgi:hypothetical protein